MREQKYIKMNDFFFFCTTQNYNSGYLEFKEDTNIPIILSITFAFFWTCDEGKKKDDDDDGLLVWLFWATKAHSVLGNIIARGC